jgi:hypothetical protein
VNAAQHQVLARPGRSRFRDPLHQGRSLRHRAGRLQAAREVDGDALVVRAFLVQRAQQGQGLCSPAGAEVGQSQIQAFSLVHGPHVGRVARALAVPHFLRLDFAQRRMVP